MQRAQRPGTDAMGQLLGQQAIHSAGVFEKAVRACNPDTCTCYRVQSVQNAADTLYKVITAVQGTDIAQP